MIHSAADHRGALPSGLCGVPELRDGIDELLPSRSPVRASRGVASGVGGIEAMGALLDPPSVVAPVDDEVHLLPAGLPGVSDEQSAGPGIERGIGGIAEPVGEDLRTAVAVGEGIVLRDAVRRAVPFPLDVEPQHLAEQHVRVLAVARRCVMSQPLVVRAPAVPDRHVQVPVRPEEHLAAVVVHGGMVDRQNGSGGRAVDRQAVLRGGELHYDVGMIVTVRRAGPQRRGVERVHPPVGRIVGMESDAKQAALVVAGAQFDDLFPQVEERSVGQRSVGHQHMYRADLVDDEHAVIDARGRRRGDRMDKAIGNQLQPELLLDGGLRPLRRVADENEHRRCRYQQCGGDQHQCCLPHPSIPWMPRLLNVAAGRWFPI